MNNNQIKSKYYITKVAKELWSILKALDMDNRAYLGPYGQIRLRSIPRSTYYKKIRKFEKMGLVKRKQTLKGNVFIVTSKAKNLRKQPAIKTHRTDGFSSLIIFDIPESKKNTRHILRRFLIRNGYTLIRESCFISPFKVSIDTLELIKELELEKNVTILSAKVDYLISNT